MVLLPGRDKVFAQGTEHQPDFGGYMVAAVNIETPVVLLVGIVGQLVIFEAIDPDIVIKVDAEEKLGPVDVVAQEGLVVVGDQVAQEAVVVLVEVGDEIVVLVPAGENRRVSGLPILAHGVGELVLVVVVFNEFDDVDALVFVVDKTVALGGEGTGRVSRVHAIGFAEEEPGEGDLGEIHHPRVG